MADNDVGPAYNSEGSTDLAEVKKDIKICSKKIEAIDILLKEKHWVEKPDFDIRNQYVETKFEELNEKVDNGLEIVNTCNERSNTNKYDLIDVKTQLEKVSDTIKSSNNIKYLRFLKNKKKLTKKESNISFSFTD